MKKGGQEQRDTTGVPVSRAFVPPCNLYWRSPTLGPATCLSASRNPSRLLQIVVPRTCVDSCTPVIKRELCQLARSAGLPGGAADVELAVNAQLPCTGAALHRGEAHVYLLR
ncbi:Uncharacterized protein ALO83_04271 [Pseudomonas cannabina pv. alisalensis]|uniref:Uncharacterized protein n=1 Tax=Pseudomonas cannabina TaxID=86840 RepID=A0A3M3S6K8_PSECA|nr:Uncharacterized protein ALO83_04271 [Pseudomonas cannabina pv. alisalensis]RMN80037.1 hypothetical protein ALQ52_04089 [Pseudomonas cannabina pv. alisalensis]RMO04270.1 hypothetical protein ALQ51_05346 [Pseudomonas cannabina]